MNNFHENMFYAHTKETTNGTPDTNQWEILDRHLKQAAEGGGQLPGASGFAEAFGASEWGRLAGQWHDLGKYSDAFQRMLHTSMATPNAPRARVDHSTAGAQHASKRFGLTGEILAFVIAGHHAGLADRVCPNGSIADLHSRLNKTAPEIADALSNAPPDLLAEPLPAFPELGLAGVRPPTRGLRMALWIRMLFSCLVDADRLATESFCNPDQADSRAQPLPSIDQLKDTFDAYYTNRFGGVDESLVNTQRMSLFHACREKALRPPGLYSLTAPTGSGKTLNSMAFALDHAQRHGLRRVIYALPFTSVTEQNADEFREAFERLGDRGVLEHHSAYANPDEDDSSPSWHRMATENWDAPVIVTTNVQLLESLFAAHTGRCRKLHRIARSVIILDEAQAIPVHLLEPTLATLDELTRNYGCSVVLCSATQPALNFRKGEFEIGLTDVHEIAPDPGAMAGAMRRVEVELVGHIEDDDLADRMAACERVLTIVNTRKHATTLYQMLESRAADVLHLSAQMCPAHRAERVKEIKDRLEAAQPCRVVSTQVVEAGVDIDFPVVYRAEAGLDSIVQAAGRCNREGKCDRGKVLVFATDVKPAPQVSSQIDHMREVLHPGDDPLDLDTIERYFRLHYWQRQCEWDKENILRGCFPTPNTTFPFLFREAERRYKVIDEHSESIVVPWGEEGKAICKKLRHPDKPIRALRRQAQRCTVSLARWQLSKLIENNQCELVHDSIWLLTEPSKAYHDQTGLDVDALPDPEKLFDGP